MWVGRFMLITFSSILGQQKNCEDNHTVLQAKNSIIQGLQDVSNTSETQNKNTTPPDNMQDDGDIIGNNIIGNII